jgi:hypothetical protein
MGLTYHDQYFLMNCDQKLLAKTSEDYTLHKDQIVAEGEEFRAELLAFLKGSNFDGVDGRVEEPRLSADAQSIQHDYMIGHLCVGLGASRVDLFANERVIEALKHHFGARVFVSKPVLHGGSPKPPRP